MSLKIRCPECKQRLFDLKSESTELEIKCPKCRAIVAVKANKLQLKAVTVK